MSGVECRAKELQASPIEALASSFVEFVSVPVLACHCCYAGRRNHAERNGGDHSLRKQAFVRETNLIIIACFRRHFSENRGVGNKTHTFRWQGRERRPHGPLGGILPILEPWFGFLWSVWPGCPMLCGVSLIRPGVVVRLALSVLVIIAVIRSTAFSILFS